MTNSLFYITLIIFIFLINYLFKKKNILTNNTGQAHQSFTLKEQVPLSGGLFLLIFFYFNYDFFSFNLIFYFSLFYLIGLFADLGTVKSPSIRFFFQIIILLMMIIDLDISIYDIRIDFLNNFLQNYFFQIFFVLYCFLVLINGANFIDGNNGISIGYFLIIFLVLFNLIANQIIFFEKSLIISFIYLLIILLIFNLFNKLYLGDNGIYLLSVFSGYLLIQVFNTNSFLTPYFIVNLLWYPAFEILFSLLRKLMFHHSPMKPDTLHLHQLLFINLSNKFKLKKIIINSLTGIIINSYNLLMLLVSSIGYQNTKLQIVFILINLSVYLFSYIMLNKLRLLNIKSNHRN